MTNIGVEVTILDEEPVEIETQSLDDAPEVEVEVSVSSILSSAVESVTIDWGGVVLGRADLNVAPGESRTTSIKLDRSQIDIKKPKEHTKFVIQALGSEGGVLQTKPVRVELIQVSDDELRRRREQRRRERERQRQRQRPDGLLDRIGATLEAEGRRREMMGGRR